MRSRWKLGMIATVWVALAACSPSLSDVEVLDVQPAPGATGVAVDATVSATFNRNLTDASLEGSVVLRAADGTEVGGALSFDRASQTATFVPESELAPGVEHTVTVAGSVRTRAGATMAGATSWSFTTETLAEPDPDPEPDPEPEPEPDPEPDPEPEPSVESVSIVEGDQALVVGDVVDLTVDVVATGGASTDVAWSSSDESVATVSEGSVSAVAEGSAVVTATSTFDGDVSDSVTVTVSPAPAVTSVSILEGDQELFIGESAALTAEVSVEGGASDEVTWSSSDDAVATVDGDGVVTAVSDGAATVTAASSFDGDVSDAVEVTVLAPLSLTVDEVRHALTSSGATAFSVTVLASGGRPGYVLEDDLDVTIGEGAVTVSDVDRSTSVDGSTYTVSGRIVPTAHVAPADEAFPIEFTVSDDDGTTANATAEVAPTDLGPNMVVFAEIDFTAPVSMDGGSVRWDTGDTCACDSAPFDFNLWDNGGALAFYWPRATGASETSGVSHDGFSYAVLTSGDTVGGSETYVGGIFSGATPDWRQAEGVDGYLGFRFENPSTSETNYGYARIVAAPDSGLPATVVWWAYDESGAAVTVPTFD